MAPAPLTHVILGDGVAGMSAVEALRRERPGDTVVVVSADPQRFYYRAALTNYLAGRVEDHELWALPAKAFDDLGISFRTGVVTGLDPLRRVVRLKAGPEIAYDRLLIATGCSARSLDATTPGAELDGVCVLRTLSDAQRLLERLHDRDVRQAVVVGAGILGLEIAHALRAERHLNVTLLHRGPWLLERVVDHRAGELIRRRAERDGVDVRLGTTIRSVTGNAKTGVTGVVLSDGSQVACGLVALALGNVPNTEFLQGVLPLSKGYVSVDPSMRVRCDPPMPDVFAAGDVAVVKDPDARCENPGGLWQPARKMGFVAGRAMAGDVRAAYRPGALYNATRAWDLDLVTIGGHVDHAGSGALALTSPVGARKHDKPVYKRAMVRDGRVVGVLLLGDRREGRALHRLMNLRPPAGDVSSISTHVFDADYDLFRWVATQAAQPGVVRDDEPVYGALGADPEAIARRRRAARPEPARPRGDRAEGSLAGGALTLRPVRGEPRTWTEGRFRIGAALDADVVVQDVALRDEVLVLAREGAAWMASSHGGGVRPRAARNGVPLTTPVALRDHDVLALGRWQALVRLPHDVAPRAAAPDRAPAFLVGLLRHALHGPIVRIGRSPDNDVVLASSTVSRFHAQLEQDAATGAWYAKDFGSTRGTSVNGEPLEVARRLADGDRLSFGPDASLVFAVGEAAAAVPDAPLAAPEARPSSVPLGDDGPRVYLVGIAGPHAGRTLAISLPGTVGRAEAASTRLDDPLVSRIHARFETGAPRPGGAPMSVTVTDPGSENGVFVRSVRSPVGLPVPLDEGDELALGRTRWRVSLTPVRGRPAVDDAEPVPPAMTTLVMRGDGPRLVLDLGAHTLEEPLVEARVTLGRARDNHIVVEHVDLTDHHAAFVVRGGTYAVEDLGSRLGTRVDGLPVERGVPVELADGARLTFGAVPATFRLGTGVVGGATQGPARYVLHAKARDRAGERIVPMALEGDGPFVIGRRRPEATLVIDVPTISRRHALLTRAGNGFTLKDLGSENGTRLGVEEADGRSVPGPAVEKQRPVPLAAGQWFFVHGVACSIEREDPVSVERATLRRATMPAVALAEGADPLDADLDRVVHEEVDACIGCHECMDACPLEDARTVTIGALNAYAQGVGSASEVVERFVADCTQCQACVPVCPADLQRSRIVLFNKMKEDRRVDPRRRLPLHVGDVATTSDVSVAALAGQLSDHPLVVPLASDERLAFLSRARLRRLVVGETLLKESAFPDAMWLVLSGRLEVGMATDKRSFQRMVLHGPGDSVGDVAVLSDQASDVTVRAVEPTLVAGFSKWLLLHHRERSPAFRKALEERYKDQATRLDAGAWPELAGLSDEVLGALRRRARLVRFAAEETVLSRAAQGSTIVLVQRGFVREVRRDPEAKARRAGLASVGAGAPPEERDPTLVFANYLGRGQALGGGDSGRRGRADRFVASTKAEVLLLDLDDLQGLDQRFPKAGVVARFLAMTRRGGAASPRTAGEGGGHRSGEPSHAGEAEGKGLLQADRLLLIDTRICVDCDNCVSACERRHGAARLDRSGCGTQVGPYQVPASCYHCDDPLCLLCAEEAIVRLPGGEIQVKADVCIGCGACAERCPYGNIEIVPRTPPRSFLTSWMPRPLLRLFGVGEDGAGDASAEVAVKCDLCVGYDDGPACVRGCPVGAAQRVDPRSVFLFGGGDT